MKLLLTALCISPLIMMAQTCVVIMYDSEKIYVGADSKVFMRANGESYNECKIKIRGSIITTGTGVRIKELMELAEKLGLSSPGLKFDDFCKIVNDSSVKYLKRVLPEIRFGDPTAYKRITQIKLISDLILCKIENGHPLIYFLSLYIENPESFAPNVTQKVLRERRHIPGRGLKFFAGRFNCIDKIPTYTTMDYKVEINKMINQAISCYSMYVGPPISIAMVKKGKAEFVQNGLCK